MKKASKNIETKLNEESKNIETKTSKNTQADSEAYYLASLDNKYLRSSVGLCYCASSQSTINK